MLDNTSEQLALFHHEKSVSTTDDVKNWGTFKDSLRAPVHRWFTYPAGFSYKAVEHSFERFNIKQGMTVYDPFMGSGTTNLVAKCLGINSVGVEAHPFVINITQAKMYWNLKVNLIDKFLNELNNDFKSIYLKKSKSIDLEVSQN